MKATRTRTKTKTKTKTDRRRTKTKTKAQTKVKSKAPDGKTFTGKSLKDTIIFFLLDETGSMSSCKDSTINGFNMYLDSLRDMKGSGKILMNLTRFNSINRVEQSLPIKQIGNLDHENYQPAGMTPLYDSIGDGIASVERNIKNSGIKKPKVLFIIQTDGEENCSRHYDREMIFRKISKLQGTNWSFVFIAANQDAFKKGNELGVPFGNVMSYTSDNAGTSQMLNSITNATRSYLVLGDITTKCFFQKKETTA